MNLRKMAASGEDIPDTKFAHDNEARQIREGDLGFVAVPQPQLVRGIEALRRDALELKQPGRGGLQNGATELTRRRKLSGGERRVMVSSST
jgi:hypothetical protein